MSSPIRQACLGYDPNMDQWKKNKWLKDLNWSYQGPSIFAIKSMETELETQYYVSLKSWLHYSDDELNELLSENVHKSVMPNLTFVKPCYRAKIIISDQEMLPAKHVHNDNQILFICHMYLWQSLFSCSKSSLLPLIFHILW